MTPSAAATALVAGSCRQCPVSCERVVQPAGCVESDCPRLYSYEREGRTWMGCLEGVYRVEIDLEGFRRLQRTAAGFGSLRASREPLGICRSAVERTFEHRGEADCVNPDFLLSGAEGYAVTATRREGDPRL
jgi:hypothetical protein